MGILLCNIFQDHTYYIGNKNKKDDYYDFYEHKVWFKKVGSTTAAYSQ